MNEEFVPPKKEECDESGCHIAIEPQSDKEKLPVESELAITLGALTSACNISNEDKKVQCFSSIEPLEKGESDSKAVIKQIIEQQGVENIEKTMKAIEELIEEAKTELKKEGRI